MATETKTPAQETAPAAKPPRPTEKVVASAEEAIKEAESRTKGPRRAFKCEHGGKTMFIVSHNVGRAGGVAFAQIGGKVEELGERARRTKALGVDGILAAVNGLPEAERNAVLEQLKAALKPSAKK